MNRINVYDRENGMSAGWFDSHAATWFEEDTYWDGNNHVSVPTRSQWDHQSLARTAGGRWVLRCSSQWQGSVDMFWFVPDRAARLWLVQNSHDAAAEKFFGPVESELAL